MNCSRNLHSSTRNLGRGIASAVTARRVKWHKSTTKRDAPNVLLPIKPITKEPELQSFLDRNSNTFAPPETTTVGVHFQCAAQCRSDVDQNKPDQVVAIAISSSAPEKVAVLLLLASLSKTRVITGMKALLSDSVVVKVMHNVHRVAFCFMAMSCKILSS